MTQTIKAEYLWLDGAHPTQELRSKTRILRVENTQELCVKDIPDWGYDGSSTYQATGGDSDLTLKPVFTTNDPIRSGNSIVVLCEVMYADGRPHESNHRAQLRDVLDKGAAGEQAWFGFEQEYTFFMEQNPLGWPNGGYPAPQGPFYCSVGANVAYGRKVVERHTDACLDAGLLLFGTNAEVMPGQWEFQIGFRGDTNENIDPLICADHLWVARWMLHRIAEDEGIQVSFENKPIKGDWNGAGMHTNFSTANMRSKFTGMGTIENAIAALGNKHQEHIAIYGAGLAERLTGEHETCSITQFRHGVADRGASIRIPRHVSQDGYGYIEDRRPGANANPYQVCSRILMSVCGID
ncbi:MAG: glutamine synthetase [Deltaproteobacteria bacterium]|nr:glutamine synthetase [Deltaproteobacteria bacterium]